MTQTVPNIETPEDRAQRVIRFMLAQEETEALLSFRIDIREDYFKTRSVTTTTAASSDCSFIVEAVEVEVGSRWTA